MPRGSNYSRGGRGSRFAPYSPRGRQYDNGREYDNNSYGYDNESQQYGNTPQYDSDPHECYNNPCEYDNDQQRYDNGNNQYDSPNEFDSTDEYDVPDEYARFQQLCKDSMEYQSFQEDSSSEEYNNPQGYNSSQEYNSPYNGNVEEAASSPSQDEPCSNADSAVPETGSWLPASAMGNDSLFSTRKQSYMSMYNAPIPPTLYADPPHLGAKFSIKKDSDIPFTDHAPYKLEKSNIILFPEWYFLFIKSVSKLAPELFAYCKCSPENLPGCFESNDYQDILDSVSEIENHFSNIFKANLGSSLEPEEYTHFSRHYVETVFVASLVEHADKSQLVTRKNKLIHLAQQGDFRPLSDFLQAFCVPEEDIWVQFLDLCLPYGVSEEMRVKIGTKWNRYQKAPGPFQFRLRSFEQALKGYKYFPVKTVGSPSNEIPPVEITPVETTTGLSRKKPDTETVQKDFLRVRLTDAGLRKSAFKAWRHQRDK